jgi:hypothetical protein
MQNRTRRILKNVINEIQGVSKRALQL